MSATALAAALLAAGTVLLALPPRASVRSLTGVVDVAQRRRSRLIGPIAVAVLFGGGFWWLHGTRLVLVAMAALAGLELLHQIGRDRDRRRVAERADRVVAVCETIAADLHVGRTPGEALGSAVEEWAELAPVARAADLAADVPTALRRLATTPGAERCSVIAAAWQVADRSGVGLAATLELIATTLSQERELARTVTAELAPARATARLLAVLPLGVLLLGSGIGADPWAFLIDTPLGLACLGAGLVLVIGGLRWINLIGDDVG